MIVNSSSLLMSGKVLWDDMVSLEPIASARRFINVFFVDQDVNVTDAVVAVRLPYDRVNITGTNPFTFSSNDVVRFYRKMCFPGVRPTFQNFLSRLEGFT